MDEALKTLYTWLELSLKYAEPHCCVHKRTKLQLVWITDEEGDDAVTWYFECPKCNKQHNIVIAFDPVSIPEGNGHKEKED